MNCTSNDPEQSPWLCHVCDKKSRGESTACEFCYRTTCTEHLTRVSHRDSESGLYVLKQICVACVLEQSAP